MAKVVRRKRWLGYLTLDAWDWAGEIVGLTLLVLVLIHMLPVWVLAIVAFLTARPFVRMAYYAARALLEG